MLKQKTDKGKSDFTVPATNVTKDNYLVQGRLKLLIKSFTFYKVQTKFRIYEYRGNLIKFLAWRIFSMLFVADDS